MRTNSFIFIFFIFSNAVFSLALDEIKMSWFEIKNINLEVQEPLTSEQVSDWLPEIKGKNLIFFSPKELMSVVTNKPWVDAVYIKKEFPHSLSIKVTTKEPKLILKAGSGSYFLGSEGEKIAVVTSENRTHWDLPLLTFPDVYEKDWDISVFYKELKVFEKKFPVSEISLGLYPEFSVFLKERRIRVILEYPHLLDSMAKLDFLLKNPPKTNRPIRQIDLTNPKKAVVSSTLSK